MNKLKGILYTFACVTTGVVFATAVYTSIFWPGEVLGAKLLWQILLVSLLCSLGNLIYPEHEVSKTRMMVLRLLHYAWVNLVVLGSGIYFGWFYANSLPMVAGMVVLIAIIFLLISVILWQRDKKLANQMNAMLKQYQKAEN